MGVGDTRQPAYPQNTLKQDWAFFCYVGGRGGGGLPVLTGITRYTFWINYDPYDVFNRQLIMQNVDFQVFSDSNAFFPITPYLVLDQSNDITDELIEATVAGLQPGQSTTVKTAGISYPGAGVTDSGFFVTGAGVPPTSSVILSPPTNVNAGLSSAVVGQLTIGQQYFYCVTALNGSSQESLPSAVVSATASATSQSIGVNWSVVPGAVAYNVYRNTTNNFTSGNLLLFSSIYPGQPPYYDTDTFTSQPVNSNFQNDQGNYTFYGYNNIGFGFGNNSMLAQGFVPTTPALTAFYFKNIFHTNTTDHTTYNQLNFELWSSSHTFIAHLGSIKPTFNNNTLIGDTTSFPNWNQVTSLTGDDGNTYWRSIDQLSFSLVKPINLTPGTTYYLVVRQAVTSSSNYYFLGMDLDPTVTFRSPLYYYPYASAYTAADGSSTWSQLVDGNGKYVTFPFTTTTNIGRTGATFWWANVANGASNYWYGIPNANEFKFLHLNYNQRI